MFEIKTFFFSQQIHSKDAKTPTVPSRTKKPDTLMQTPMQTQQSSYLRKSHNNRVNPVEKHWIPMQVGCNRLERSVDLITEQASALFYNSEYKNCVEVLDELSQYLEFGMVSISFETNKKCRLSYYVLQNFQSRSIS